MSRFWPVSKSFRCLFVAMAMVMAWGAVSAAWAQDDDGESDPIKLFDRAQDAHAKGNLERAVALYDQAIKLRPEFPEAELQRGMALSALGRNDEAEKSLRRAIQLRKDWSLPYTALGDLLSRTGHTEEAQTALRHALELGAKDYVTLDALATLRLNAGDKAEALTLAKRATAIEDVSASAWALRGLIERESEDRVSAAVSIAHALDIEPTSIAALKTSAELHADNKDYPRAIEDLKTALAVRPGDKKLSIRMGQFYEAAGNADEARRIYESIGIDVTLNNATPRNPQVKGVINVTASAEDIAAANNDDPKIARPALEKLIAANKGNAALLARLGEITRTTDPAKSLESYETANKIEPTNTKYATGYAAALVQTRRFGEAVGILRRVLVIAPDDYAAHTNLALALFELKQWAEALPIYNWIADSKPDVAATYFFIAIAHDNLGEYPQALESYEKFLSRADPVKNQLEIDKVNLRLPKLRDQIKRGQGVKPKHQ